MHQRKPNDRDSTRIRDITIKMPVVMAQDPEGKVVTEIPKPPETAKTRPGEGLIKTKSNAITARDGDIYDMSAPALKMTDL